MIEKEPLILVGGGGHCCSVIDVIESQERYHIAGIVDKKEYLGKKLLGYPFVGEDKDLPELIQQYKNVFITAGMIKDSILRSKLFLLTQKLGANFPIIVSSNAYVSKHVKISKGTVIMHGATINAGCQVGENCIINTNSLIEHDCVVGDHCHISTGSIVNGTCTIGNNVMIGSNAVISNGLSIAGNSIIGAGAVVIRSVLEPNKLVGNPARKI